jgi:hypothetical protein
LPGRISIPLQINQRNSRKQFQFNQIMKTFLHWFLISFLFLTACSTGESPKKVATAFLNEINKQQFEEAKKLATPETGKMLDIMASLVALSSNKSLLSKDFKIVNEEINGDAATVKYQEEGKDIEFIKLIKKDQKWLVSVSKEDMATKNVDKSLIKATDMLTSPSPASKDTSTK